MRNVQIILALLVSFVALSASKPGSSDPFGRELLRREASPQAPRPTSGQGDPVVGDAIPQTTTETTKRDNTRTTGKPKSGDSSATGKSSSKSSKGSTSTRKTRIPATAIAGQVIMKTPAPQDGYSIFKIGETLTFAWNYTGLIVTPTAINVEAFCTDGANYFTISGNASGDTTKVTWDTGEYQRTASTKLPIATYTLMVYTPDNGGSSSSQPSPGHLAPFAALRFGMYTPKLPVPLSEFECPTCEVDASSALLDKYTLRMGLLMTLLATLSFTWFMAGAF